MFRLSVTIHPDDEDDLVTRLHSTSLTGLAQENRDDGLVDFQAWYATKEKAQDAQQTLQNPDRQGGDDLVGHPLVVHLDEIPNQDWNATYQATWQPIEVGERWYLTPPGDSSPIPSGRIKLEMKAGLAFGNGDHPTTHLCLIALESLIKPDDTFLDVGCGSGLLGEAAAALGAQAFGCDLAPTDLPATAFLGSVDAIKDQSIDVAVMNIQAGILTDLWPDLSRISKRAAILSGFLPEQSDQIQALIQAPWRVAALSEKDGWCALVATR
jgi:ribosomal protein L11 methyltransferase